MNSLQESGVRRNRDYIGGSRKNCLLIFPHKSAHAGEHFELYSPFSLHFFHSKKLLGFICKCLMT